jgi:2-dehydro-3-deoxy-D-arabinonate dehydratase
MKLAKLRMSDGPPRVAMLDKDVYRLLDMTQVENIRTLADILHSPDPRGLAKFLVDKDADLIGVDEAVHLPPIDRQEVWAAGVTYKRSQVARMEESEAGASHYDRVYTAPRPEIFFKATPHRVVGPGEPVRVRYDSNWSVPEPELTLVISPDKKLVGFTIGNDMSARDIEGENPLYLPQAKMYSQCAAIGPCILLPDEPLNRAKTDIKLTIKRAGKVAFTGATKLDQMDREFEELIGWLGRENDLPTGAFLMTGTGIVPNDDFTLEHGDEIAIEITGIGTLINPVVKEKK